MQIGFFGGSFDPPHNGHLAVARAAAAAVQLERVLLAPTARQPLKAAGANAAFADRLAMTGLLCESAGPGVPLEASSLDAALADGEPNYTVDTLARLRTTLRPDDAVFAIVGADAFLDLRRWREPERLLELAEWIVVSRPGFELGQLDAMGFSAQQRKRVHVLEGLAQPESATEIRLRLRKGLDCGALLPVAVLQYLREHHLYGT